MQWPVIEDSEIGDSLRNARNARSAKGRASAKRKRAAYKTAAKQPVHKPTEDLLSLATPAPSTSTSASSTREFRIPLPHIPEYEAVLSDPNRTAVALQNQQLELQALQRREKQELEVLQLLVTGRRRMIKTLVGRLDKEEKRMRRTAEKRMSDEDYSDEDSDAVDTGSSSPEV